MSIMMEELLSAPEFINKVEDTNLEVIRNVVKRVKAQNINFIATVARGTSNNAASFFKYMVERKNGFMVSKFNHSVTTICKSKINMKNCLCIGISQSGMSDDTIKVMEMAKSQGAITLAVTNNENSPLAKMCDFHLYLNCGEELSVAATKTFSLQLANLQLLADMLTDGKKMNFKNIAKDANIFITENLKKIEDLAEKTKDINNMIILSRGETLSIGEEMSLKLLETCYKFSRCYSVAEFSHGPFALVDDKREIILLAPDGEFKNDFLDMAKRLKNNGAKIIAFSDIDAINNYSDVFIKMTGGKESNPYIFCIAVQAYAAFMAKALKLNPDKPRGLNKVTITL